MSKRTTNRVATHFMRRTALACALSLLTHDASLTPLGIREALAIHEEIVHVTVEIHRCDECPPAKP